MMQTLIFSINNDTTNSLLLVSIATQSNHLFFRKMGKAPEWAAKEHEHASWFRATNNGIEGANQ
jgi:hypothetical protein